MIVHCQLEPSQKKPSVALKWRWNDSQSLVLLRRGALCFSRRSSNFKAIRLQKIVDFDPNWAFPDCNSNLKVTRDKKLPILTRTERFRTVTPVLLYQWLWHDAQSLKQHRRDALLFFKVIRQISRSNGTKNADFGPNWAFPDCNTSLVPPIAMKWCTKLEAA